MGSERGPRDPESAAHEAWQKIMQQWRVLSESESLTVLEDIAAVMYREGKTQELQFQIRTRHKEQIEPLAQTIFRLDEAEVIAANESEPKIIERIAYNPFTLTTLTPWRTGKHITLYQYFGAEVNDEGSFVFYHEKNTLDPEQGLSTVRTDERILAAEKYWGDPSSVRVLMTAMFNRHPARK